MARLCSRLRQRRAWHGWGLYTKKRCPMRPSRTANKKASGTGSKDVCYFNLVLDSRFAEAQTRCEEAQRLANEIGDGVQKSDRNNLIFIQANLARSLLFVRRKVICESVSAICE